MFCVLARPGATWFYHGGWIAPLGQNARPVKIHAPLQYTRKIRNGCGGGSVAISTWSTTDVAVASSEVCSVTTW